MDDMIDLYSSLTSFVDKLNENTNSKSKEKLMDGDKIVVADFKVVE